MMRTIAVDKSYTRMALTRLLSVASKKAKYGPWSPVKDLMFSNPTPPSASGVVVAVDQSGICATDVALLDARIDPSITVAALPGRERVFLGHEAVGHVTRVGSAVHDLAVGDRVILDTRFQGPTCASEHLAPCTACRVGNPMLCTNPDRFPAASGIGGGWSDALTADRSELYAVADSALTNDQAMLIEPFSLGVRTALKALPAPDGNVLVIGAGMAGIATISALRALQPRAEVAVVARHLHQRDAATNLGAHFVINDLNLNALANHCDAPVHAAPFGARYVMGGYDVVIDTVGSARTLNAGLRLVRPGGTLVLVGITMQRTRLDLSPIWHQEVTVKGVLAHGTEHHHATSGTETSTFDLTAELIGSGRIPTAGVITDRYPLTEWSSAVERSRHRNDGVVRVALDCRDS